MFTRYDDTASNDLTGTAQPDWTGRLDVNYTQGAVRLSYQAFYFSPVAASPDATIETTPDSLIASNVTHSVSAEIRLARYAFRVG